MGEREVDFEILRSYAFDGHMAILRETLSKVGDLLLTVVALLFQIEISSSYIFSEG